MSIKHVILVFFSLTTLSSASRAADFSICESIAGKAGALVDKSDSEQWEQAVNSEFANICKDSEKYESNLSSSSNSTQAAFGYAGFSLGFGQSANDANSRSSKAIDAVCKTGKSYVSAYFHSIDRTVSGQYAVNLVGDCLRLLAQADLEALTGTTEVSNASDSAFFVRVEYRPSSAAPNKKYKLVNIQVDPMAEVSCSQTPGVDVQGNMVVEAQAQNTFTCTRKAGQDVNGAFNFAADSDSTVSRSLHFSVPSLSGHELVREKIKQEIETEITNKLSRLSYIQMKAETDLNERMKEIENQIDTLNKKVGGLAATWGVGISEYGNASEPNMDDQMNTNAECTNGTYVTGFYSLLDRNNSKISGFKLRCTAVSLQH